MSNPAPSGIRILPARGVVTSQVPKAALMSAIAVTPRQAEDQ